MKRLVVCCDGTWQSADNEVPTNVLKIAQGIFSVSNVDQTPQVLFYDEGIGAVPRSNKRQRPFLRKAENVFKRVTGGAFGWGIDEKIKEAYIFLSLNYVDGDEIYLFGFSRGAYTVRSLAGLIDCCGLLKRPNIGKTGEAYEIYRLTSDQERSQQAQDFRNNNAHALQEVSIKFLGCWDTVAALGIPNWIDRLKLSDWINARYAFHNNKLSAIIENARHAIAINEKREAFAVTIMVPSEDFIKKNNTLKQVLFPGDHGCIGGGTEDCLGIANIALKWMAEEAKQCSLALDLSRAKRTDYFDPQVTFNSKSMLGTVGEDERNFEQLNQELPNGFELIVHPSVKERWRDPDNYPQNIRGVATKSNSQ